VVCVLGGLVARSTRLVTRSLGQWHRCYRRAKRTSVDLGFAELELGITVRDVIAHVGGGTRPRRSIKAVFSGVSNGVITADHLDVPATYEHLAAIGSGLGSAGFIVYDDTADMAAVARMFARFLHVESCGQCGACKLHSGTVSDTLARLQLGAADDHDIAQLGPTAPDKAVRR
jgi:NADH-quinone oxidoreductase subunit F